MEQFFPPVYKASSFHCPFCNVKAHQQWYIDGKFNDGNIKYNKLDCSVCVHCNKAALWLDKTLLYPKVTIAPKPHFDLPNELLSDYLEASSILVDSPRGAAAILRLVLQKLMAHLGESGRDINKDIGSLVKKGLHPDVQKALDIVRVIGNESVHPGQLDLQDDVETANQLFGLINFIIEDRITRPKAIDELFSKLPEGKRKGIEDRDKIKTP